MTVTLPRKSYPHFKTPPRPETQPLLQRFDRRHLSQDNFLSLAFWSTGGLYVTLQQFTRTAKGRRWIPTQIPWKSLVLEQVVALREMAADNWWQAAAAEAQLVLPPPPTPIPVWGGGRYMGYASMVGQRLFGSPQQLPSHLNYLPVQPFDPSRRPAPPAAYTELGVALRTVKSLHERPALNVEQGGWHTTGIQTGFLIERWKELATTLQSDFVTKWLVAAREHNSLTLRA